jgi:formylglycine-generating enzyme required for sulfatase activity
MSKYFLWIMMTFLSLLLVGCSTTSTPSVPPVCTEIGQTWISPKDGMTLVCVPAGEFTMGSQNGSDDEQPVHAVTLDAYWIDQTEVTNAMVRKCVRAKQCSHPDGDPYYISSTTRQHPVAHVSWEDANAYCTWVGRRLPTEAEWEKAARGVDGRTYPWGDQTPDCTLANYGGCFGQKSAVGSYPAGASPYNALDMAGNVWEWVADWYGADYYTSQLEWNNPLGPATGDAHSMRGGFWSGDEAFMRASVRSRHISSDRYDYIGFRCVWSP